MNDTEKPQDGQPPAAKTPKPYRVWASFFMTLAGRFPDTGRYESRDVSCTPARLSGPRAIRLWLDIQALVEKAIEAQRAEDARRAAVKLDRGA